MCEHCVAAVTDALKALGLKDISVDLKAGRASFASNAAVSDEQIVKAVADADYAAKIIE